MTNSAEKSGFFANLLAVEAELVDRITRVFRFDESVYQEVEEDPHAIPQATLVVMATSVLIGLGQGSIAAAFLGIAGGIIAWLVTCTTIWAVGMLFTGEPAEYTRMLRGLGFAFAWNALMIISWFPILGTLLQWIGFLAWFGSMILAVRQGLQTSTPQAALIAVIALCMPFVLLWLFN